MLSIRRLGLTLGLILAGALASVGVVAAQSPSPEADGLVDPGAVLPARIGAVELAIQTRGTEEMAERLQAADDLLLATLAAVLSEAEAPAVSMALASPADPDTVERYELVALHVAGTDAGDLVSRMFRHMMAEQIRASGVEDPEEIERMTAGFEAVLPRVEIGDREVLSPNEGTDTAFEFFYPSGEILFIGRGSDGSTMEEVLASLP